MQESFEVIRNWMTDPMVIRVFTIVLATLVANYVAVKVLARLQDRAERSSNVWDDALIRASRGPLAWLIAVMGISWAVEVISLEADAGLGEVLVPIRYLLIIGLLALLLVRFIREMEKAFISRGSDIMTAQAVGKLLRLSVIITASLSVLQTLGVSISGVLAFGGIGGIAVGFAARDLLANFFGGLVIHLDRPFAVGDWVRSPDREMEGTVEEIGWRLSVIRTFDQRPLYVPNAVFSTVAVENPSRMFNRRISEVVGVRYADVGKVKLIVDDIRQMLIDHPEMETDARTLIVNFNKFNASSLDIFVYTFTKTTNWVEFHQLKERILLAIHDIVEKHGAEVAFPTQTLHVASLPDAEPEPLRD